MGSLGCYALDSLYVQKAVFSTEPVHDSLATVSEDGHLKCIIKPTINCTNHTITLEAWTTFLFTGVEVPVSAQWNTGEFLHKIVVTEGGTYTWDATGFGCDHQDNTITVPDFFPGPLVITGETVLCAGDQFDLEVNDQGYNFVNYTWSPFNTTLTPILITSPGTYSLTVTDQNGCTYTDNHTVTQSPPVVPFIQGPFVMCSVGDSAILNVIGGNFATYEWDHGPTTSSVVVYEPGLYVVTVTNAIGCTGTSLINVENGDVNGLGVTVTQNAICVGQLDTLTAVGNNFTTYKWSSGQTTKRIIISQPGTYTVTVTNIAGCTGTASVTILPVQPPAPQVNLPVLCPGGSAILSTANGPFNTYTWSTGLNTSSININAPGTYTVTVTNSIGCTGTTNVTVATATPPPVAITGPATACPGQSANLSATAGYTNYIWSTTANTSTISVNQTGVYTVTITGANGCTNSVAQNFAITSAPTPMVTVAPYACNNQMTLSADPGYPGYNWSNGLTTQSINVQANGVYTVTVTAGVGCTGSSTQTITIPANPQVNITGIPQFCAGANSQLQSTAGFVQYQWSGGGTTSSILVNASGTYTVTVTDNNNCTSTDDFQVTATPLPQPGISGPLAICQGNTTQWSVSAPFDQYQWSTGNSGASITVALSGPYTVTVTDNNGCTGSTTQNLTVNASLITQIAAAPYACDNQINLTADPGFTTYNWSNGSTTQNASALANGAYTVTVTDASGCTGTAIENVNIPTNPSVNIVGPTQICPGGTAILNASGAYPQYNWSLGSNLQQVSTAVSGNFTVTVTDLNGCTSTALHTVNFGTSLSIAVAVSPYACDNQLSLTPGQGFSTYNWSTGASTPSINVQSGGTYSVTVTDATGCTGTTDQIVNIPSNPSVSISGPTQLCFGANGTLIASGSYPQYAWSTGFASPDLPVNQSGTFTVVVTDANGCTATANAAVNVLPQVIPQINGPAIICPGSNAQFSTSVPFTQYQWSNGSNNASITVSLDGDYTVTVTDANGCTGVDFQGLNISMSPTPSISVAPYNCNNLLNLSANTGYNTYNWSNGSTNNTAIANLNGGYTVTVTDALGCTGVISQAVNIPLNPTVNINGPSQVCAGFGAQFLASGAYPQYSWSTGSSNLSITVLQSGNYTVTITDGNGCTASSSANLVVLAPVQPSITGPTLICPNTSSQFNAGNGYIQYNWSTGSTNASINASLAGLYTVTVTDLNGCTGTDTENLAISPSPAPAISVAPYNCNNTLSLSANQGFVTYNWSNTNTTSSIVAQTNGAYTVTVTNALGCTGTAVQNINIPVNPQVIISGPAQLCAGQNAQYIASGNYPQYAWSIGASGPSLNVSQSGNYVVTVTDNNGCTATDSQQLTVNALNATNIQKISCFAQDTGSVVVTLLNQFGCDSVVTTQTTLSPPVTVLTTVTSDYNGSDVSCFGAADGNAKVTALTGVAPFTYKWSNNNTTSTIQNLSVGNYAVTITDSNGCTTTSSISLSAPPPIVPELEPVQVECFEPGSVAITNVTGGTLPYSLSCNNTTLEDVEDFPKEFLDLAPGNYTVLVTDANGCTSQQPFQLIAPNIQTEVTMESFWIDAGDKIKLKAPTGYKPLSIEWTPSTGLSCNDCLVTEARVFETREYQVTLQGYGSCEVIKKFLIQVRPSIFVPNVIMPSSAENNLFTIYAGKGDLNIRVLRIFTRWGEMVEEIVDFAPNGPVGWQGDFNGTPVNPGVYVYYAEVVTGDGEVVLLKGDVTVIR